jgi:hypothetical protein
MFLSEQIYLFSRAASAGTTSSILLLSTACAAKLSVHVADMFLGFLKQMHADGNSWKSSCFGLISSGAPIRPL